MRANPTAAPQPSSSTSGIPARTSSLLAQRGARGGQQRAEQGAPVTHGAGDTQPPGQDAAGEHTPLPHRAPEHQLTPVGTGRLVYMLHQISCKSGTTSSARSCRSHLIPLLLPARRSSRRHRARRGAAGTSPSSAQLSPTDTPRPAAVRGAGGGAMGLVLLTRGRWERGKEQDSPELCHHSPRLHAASPGSTKGTVGTAAFTSLSSWARASDGGQQVTPLPPWSSPASTPLKRYRGPRREQPPAAQHHLNPALC